MIHICTNLMEILASKSTFKKKSIRVMARSHRGKSITPPKLSWKKSIPPRECIHPRPLKLCTLRHLTDIKYGSQIHSI